MAKQDISLDIPTEEGRVVYGAEMRRRVQRLIERAKKSNVPDYAAYIYSKAKAGEGFTPQVVLWTPVTLHTVVDESTGLGAIIIPDEMRLIAIDGDTQATARHEARRLYADMPDSERIKIVILHGIGIEAAQQVFHDANARGVKVSTSLAIGFDNRDPVTQLVKRIEAETPELRGRVNYQKRQLGKADPELLTASALRTGVVCFVEGISGVQRQTESVTLPAASAALIEQAALKWFRLVVKTLNGALEARATTFATAPSVWAALGALGNTALHDAAAEQVRPINWSRGEHWLGSGAKSAKTGVTLGGPKEAGHLVFRAMTASEDAAY